MRIIIALFLITHSIGATAQDYLNYERREKSFKTFQVKEELRAESRQKAGVKQTQTRLEHEKRMDKIRDNYKRVEYSNAKHEPEFLKKQQARKEVMDAKRAKFAEEQVRIQKIVEEKILPLKRHEYGLDKSEAETP